MASPRAGERMNAALAQLRAALDARDACVWIVVARVSGSAPREAGASMIVSHTTTWDTIGGGHLELKAIEFGRELLTNSSTCVTLRHFPLGPSLGQCCGGHVSLLFVPINDANRAIVDELHLKDTRGAPIALSATIDTGEAITVPLPAERWNIAVFGAGHVGRAIVNVLSNLPCQITWIDERTAEFPAQVAGNVHCVNTDAYASEVRNLPSGAQVLVLTHSHAIDLEICLALLKRDDFAYCGLIGSATKAATFRKRFEQRGASPAAIARIICPIGQRGLRSKHPGAIAASVAFDLALRHERSVEQNVRCHG